MLSPHDRTALFDALRPPPGYDLDHTVGTSFTLDLEALLTAPIAFALFAGQDVDPSEDGLEPVGLLMGVHRASVVMSEARSESPAGQHSWLRGVEP